MKRDEKSLQKLQNSNKMVIIQATGIKKDLRMLQAFYHISSMFREQENSSGLEEDTDTKTMQSRARKVRWDSESGSTEETTENNGSIHSTVCQQKLFHAKRKERLMLVKENKIKQNKKTRVLCQVTSFPSEIRMRLKNLHMNKSRENISPPDVSYKKCWR